MNNEAKGYYFKDTQGNIVNTVLFKDEYSRNKIKEKITVFDDVSIMISDSSISNGMTAKTLGYYLKNDGGGSLYNIRNRELTDIIDNSVIISLCNNCVAELIVNKIMSPLQYGAKGDGLTDDTLNLQKTIKSNTVINLMQKSYLITSQLNFNNLKNVEICNGKILHIANDTHNMIVGENATHINIHNIEFDGVGNNQSTVYTWQDNIQGCIILASGCNDINITNCIIKNFHYGVFTLGADEDKLVEFATVNSTISDNTFSNCNSCIDTYGKNIKISGNYIVNCTQHAIQIEPNETITNNENPLLSTNYYTSAYSCDIINNYIIHVSGIAINIQANTLGIVVSGNTVIDFEYGINATRSLNVIISNNSLYDQKQQLYTVDIRPWTYKASITCKGGIVSSNYMRNVDIGIYSIEDCNIENNHVINARVSGVVMYSSSLSKVALLSGTIIDNENELTNEIWWASRPIVVYNTKGIINNCYVHSSKQPLYMQTSEIKIINLISNIAITDTLTPLSNLSVNSF